MPGRFACRAVLVLACATVPAMPATLMAQDRLVNVDSTFSVVLPTRFHPILINENADLQFADTLTEAYVMALWEGKEDLVGWNLVRHSTITLAQVLAGLDYPEVTGPVSRTIGGHPATEYGIRGASQGMRIAYLHTSIESPVGFVQLVAWTRASTWDSVEEDLRAIIESAELAADFPRVSTDIHDIVPGLWAWESREELCGGRTQRFVISPDRASMQIHHSEPIESATGDTTSVTDYVIEGSGPRVLHTYIPGETRLTDSGDPVKWDLVVIGRNRIAWHRADWPQGGYTGMLRRCE